MRHDVTDRLSFDCLCFVAADLHKPEITIHVIFSSYKIIMNSVGKMKSKSEF